MILVAKQPEKNIMAAPSILIVLNTTSFLTRSLSPLMFYDSTLRVVARYEKVMFSVWDNPSVAGQDIAELILDILELGAMFLQFS